MTGVNISHSVYHTERTGSQCCGSWVGRLRQIADAVERSVRAGSQCVVLGGDHSLAIGSVAGHARACRPSELGVVWVDAHADVNPPRLSPSGNVHGMPLAFLLHELRDLIPADLPPQFDWLQPW